MSGQPCSWHNDPSCPLCFARVRFWSCPVEEHRSRQGVVTVKWIGGVAHCTAPDCGKASA